MNINRHKKLVELEMTLRLLYEQRDTVRKMLSKTPNESTHIMNKLIKYDGQILQWILKVDEKIIALTRGEAA